MTTLPTLGVHIRWMVRRDLPAVVATEAASFTVPLTEDDILAHLRKRNCIGMVAEAKHDARVVAHMIYEMRAAHLRLVTLAVAPDRRGRGVGTAMVSKLVWKVGTHRRARIETTVGETNAAGLAFLRDLGFRATGVVWGWGESEDGIDLEYTPHTGG